MVLIEQVTSEEAQVNFKTRQQPSELTAAKHSPSTDTTSAAAPPPPSGYASDRYETSSDTKLNETENESNRINTTSSSSDSDLKEKTQQQQPEAISEQLNEQLAMAIEQPKPAAEYMIIDLFTDDKQFEEFEIDKVHNGISHY